jgi:hypothetical protein
MTTWVFVLVLYFVSGTTQRVAFTFPTEALCRPAYAHMTTSTEVHLDGTGPGASATDAQLKGYALEACRPQE